MLCTAAINTSNTTRTHAIWDDNNNKEEEEEE